jgi:hypothetical protein
MYASMITSDKLRYNGYIQTQPSERGRYKVCRTLICFLQVFYDDLMCFLQLSVVLCVSVLFQNIMKSSEVGKESFPVISNSTESVKSTVKNNSSPYKIFANKSKFPEPNESSLYPHRLYR